MLYIKYVGLLVLEKCIAKLGHKQAMHPDQYLFDGCLLTHLKTNNIYPSKQPETKPLIQEKKIQAYGR